ncbi:hypothetical protein [Gemmobacter denitrificans]|uniref:Uncharacterized protein n=1 Tax=Gemmobacter denitrificans TaxID=3123040 RepID=A0ABU8BSI7_9RHOB
MGDQRAISALKDLIDAIEAGTATKDKEGWMHLPMTSLGGGRFRSVIGTAYDAYNGSLDAAKALHGAMAQDWGATYLTSQKYLAEIG